MVSTLASFTLLLRTFRNTLSVSKFRPLMSISMSSVHARRSTRIAIQKYSGTSQTTTNAESKQDVVPAVIAQTVPRVSLKNAIEDAPPSSLRSTISSQRRSNAPELPASLSDPFASELPSLEEEEPTLQVKTKKRKTTRKAKNLRQKNGDIDPSTTDTSTEVQPEKKKRRRNPRPEPVYIIPDVEMKSTTYRGRLGYACLNTILRNKKPADDAVFCSRTCRIDSIEKMGIDFVKDIGRQNLEDMLTVIQWNEDNNIRFMRLSSGMFPFASHPKYGYSLEYCAPLLAQVGELAARYGHRLTTHPGQYTQLGSPNPKVREAAVKELLYHTEMLESMGVGPDGVMIVHGGGTYGDKPAALERIKQTVLYDLPPNVRARLVLENDEMCYNAEELLPLCEELDIPLIFDYHHDALYPSSISPSEIIARTNAIFTRRGIRPKQHLSAPRRGAVTLMERRAHADRVNELPAEVEGTDVDLMIEAKDKEQAVLHLYRIYNLQPVNHASLRPPAELETTQTKGRKSNKRAKALKEAAALDADADDIGGVLDPVVQEQSHTGDVSAEKATTVSEKSNSKTISPKRRKEPKRKGEDVDATGCTTSTQDTPLVQGVAVVQAPPTDPLPTVPVGEESADTGRSRRKRQKIITGTNIQVTT